MKMNPTLLGSTIVAALGGLLFGFDTVVISGAQDQLKTLFNLSGFMQGFMTASALIGTIIGSVIAGKPGDAYGRRDSLKITGIVYLISALGCAAAWDFNSLVAFRFIGGIAIGASSVLGPLYLVEIAPTRIRGRLVGFFQFNVVLGILLAYVVNFGLGLLSLGAQEWRWKLGIVALPAIAFFLCLFFIPRSPRWLTMKGHHDEAKQVLKKIGSEDWESRFEAIRESIHGEQGRSEPLFRRIYFVPIFLAWAVAMFNQLTGINALLYYMNPIFSMAGFDKVSGDLQSVAVGVTMLLSTLFGMLIIDHVGRRPLLLVGSVGMAIALGGVALIFNTGEHKNLVIWLLLFYTVVFSFGQGAVIWVYISEIFPNAVRAKGQAFGSFTHWFMAAVVSWIFPVFARNAGEPGAGIPFFFFATMMVLQFVVVWKFFPETKGVSLEDMEKNTGGFGHRKSSSASAVVRTILIGFLLAGASLSATAAPYASLTDKTLVVWCSPANLDQRGSGLLTVDQTSGFDSIVFGEMLPRRWMSGSENFARTQKDQASNEQESVSDRDVVEVAIVYEGKSVKIYRDGDLYTEYENDVPMEFTDASKIYIGLRHQALMSGLFAGSIEEARIYDKPLSEAQIKDLKPNTIGEPKPFGMWTFEKGTEDQMGNFSPGELQGGASIKDGRLILDGQDGYMSVGSDAVGAAAKPVNEIHYRPASGVCGDAIPFYWKGEYHVFYLHGSSWDHIVSRDLIHWKELPTALKKGTDPLGPDGEACWTGSIVENKGTFYLFYTGKNMKDPKGDQKVMLATSKDLIDWTVQHDKTFYADGKNYWSKPVNGAIDDKLIYHHQAFRDPAVFWNAKANEWWMTMHACLPDGSSPAMALFTSKDLDHWTPQKPLLVYSKGVSGDCPDIFQSGGKWFIHCADNRYFSAPEAAGPYELAPEQYDVGDLRVPKVMFDGKRHIFTGWIGDREANSDAKPMIWGGTLCMPREFYVNASGDLVQRPVQEVVDAFSKVVVSVPAGEDIVQQWTIPQDFMFHAKLQAKSPDTKVAILFRQPSDGAEGGYHVKIDFQTQEVELGDKYRANKRVCKMNPGEPVDIRFFAIGDVIECFINDSYAFTMRGYDWTGGKLSIAAPAGSIENLGLTVSERKL